MEFMGDIMFFIGSFKKKVLKKKNDILDERHLTRATTRFSIVHFYTKSCFGSKYKTVEINLVKTNMSVIY